MKMRILHAAVFVFALSVGMRADMGGCQEFSGGFTSTIVPAPMCPSPVGLCTHGVLTGDIEGTYDFVATERFCAGPESPDPSLCTYAGDSVVTTTHGTIITKDTGVMHVIPSTAAPFVTTAESIEGTHRFKNAESVFVATGELNLITGEAVGTYTLQVCHAH